ncbi:Vacuolar protein 8 [Dissophora globulifera]|uniref:Vacuolar protein 8 n=1 Tax=Dissophora globulifera TaxID=979702 RepID=A0A9P6RX29_9FUNG|nr:Vacuolar protein 8 [Dissophora globulifera]
MEPILYMLRSSDVAVLKPSLFALAKLVHQDEKNSKLAVELGALEDLNRLMRAAAPNIHGIALAVIREVIENESLRVEVARSGVIGPLFLLASSNDPRVSRNVAATFCEFSQTSETRRMIVEAGAIPFLIRFLDFNPDIQTVAVRALADISIDHSYRRMIVNEQEGLISTLVDLLDSHNPDIPPAAALALSRMTFDQDFKAEILQTQVLTLLSQMMRSNSYQFIRHSVRLFLALYKDLAIGTTHIEAAITDRIVELISYKGNSDIQYDAIFSLYGLSNNDQNAREVIRAGAVDRICDLVSQANLRLQSQMTSFLCHLTSFESLGPQLGRSGLFEVLIPLSLSTHEKVWTASAGAILQIIDTKDHISISRVWNAPTGGLRNCFIRSLRSNYGSLQHLTIRTIFKWLEDENLAMKILITGSPEILTRVKEIANDAEACAPIPVEDLRDNVDLDPSVITMVQAGLIVDMLELKIMEEKSSYILWEDIQRQFGNVQYVMNDGVWIPFMRDASHEDILPQRIEAQKDVTLEVVLQESKHEVDDDASSMPDLELLSIADPGPKHKLETIHGDGASNAQKGFNNAQDVLEVKALYYLMRHMKEYEEKITVENFLEGKPLHMMSTLAFSNNLERQRVVAQYYTILSTQVDESVSEDALGSLLHLLQSNDLEVQRSSTAALYRLSVNVENKTKIVKLEAIEPLIRLMLSPDIAVHTDASACICSLAQLDGQTRSACSFGATDTV